MKLTKETTTKSVWYPKSKRPIVFTKQEKKSKSFYGALNVKTGKEHIQASDWQESKETIKFLEKLRKIYYNQDILLIWEMPVGTKAKKSKNT